MALPSLERDARRPHWVAPAAIIVLAVATATGLRYLLDPFLGESYPYLLFVFPALLLADRGGWPAGAAALAVGFVTAHVLFAAPNSGPGLVFYLAVGGAGVALAAGRRGALERAAAAAEQAAAEAAAHAQTQEALRKHQAGLLDHAHEPILAWEPGRGITYWNGGAERLYGYPAEEALGKDSHELLQTEFPDGRAAFETALERDGRWEGELRHRTRAGAWVRVDSRVSVVHQSGGRPVVLEANRDVTDRARAREALARLAAIVESSDDAVISNTLDGVIRTWNAGAERLYGYTAGEAVGRHLGFIIPPDRRHEEDDILARVRRGERVPPFETVRVAKDGRPVPVSLAVSPVRDADGRVVGASKVARDITARQRAEAALRASEARFRNFVEQASDAFFLHDPDGTIVDVNRQACEGLGYARGELIGLRVEDICPAVTPDQFRRVGEQLAAGQTVTIEDRHRRRDGTSFPVEVRLSPFEVDGRRQVLALARDVTDRHRAEEALRLRDRAIQAINLGILITDPDRPDDPVIYASPGFERLTGYPASDVLGRNCRFLQGADTDPQTVAQVRAAVRAARECTVELLNYRKDGTPFWNELSVTPVRDDGGRLTHFVGVQTDVTGRRRLEEQFRQAQKMEAVGQLAGGVAHDFNNLLTVINGYSEVLLAGLPPDDALRPAAEEVYAAGERAALLTRQLLTFSRREVVETRLVDLNAVVAGVARLLRRLIGEDIRLDTGLGPDLDRVRADPGQLEQVLMNLAVNARDAMPTGGRLAIGTANTPLAAGDGRLPGDAPPGPYVRLAVADTGHGMPPDVRARIFEPFFTTKGAGKGTGLGLATVFGIVKAAGGFLAVSSEVGRGTAFEIFFPSAGPPDGSAAGTAAAAGPARGTETVLVVEDDDQVRAFTAAALETLGYTALVARSGAEAAELAAGHAGDIHLVVTDVVMPAMSGRQVAEAVRRAWPAVKVLYVSGYTDDAVVRHGVPAAGADFLQKPFTLAALGAKVRAVLDGGPAG